MDQLIQRLGGEDDSPRRRDHGAHSHDESEGEEEPRQRPRARREAHDEDQGMRIDIPEFDGSLDPEKFLDWVQRIERIFEYKDYDDRKRFKVATLKLTKYASMWYENLKAKRRREGKIKIESWEQLKSRMRRRFVPTDYIQDLYLKLTSLKQGSLSVELYINEFERLSMACDLEEKAELKIAQFIGGLNYHIAEKVKLQPYWSFKEVCKVALRVERQAKSKKVATFGSNNKGAGSSRGESTKPSVTFYQRFDRFKNGASKDAKPLNPDEKRICFKCKGYGHSIKNCPNNRVITLSDAQEIEGYYASGSVIKEEELPKEAFVEEQDDHFGDSKIQSDLPLDFDALKVVERETQYLEAVIHSPPTNDLSFDENLISKYCFGSTPNLRPNFFQEGENDTGMKSLPKVYNLKGLSKIWEWLILQLMLILDGLHGRIRGRVWLGARDISGSCMTLDVHWYFGARIHDLPDSKVCFFSSFYI